MKKREPPQEEDRKKIFENRRQNCNFFKYSEKPKPLIFANYQDYLANNPNPNPNPNSNSISNHGDGDGDEIVFADSKPKPNNKRDRSRVFADSNPNPDSMELDEEEEEPDPEYTLFLKNLKEDESSYVLKVRGETGADIELEYEHLDSVDPNEEDPISISEGNGDDTRSLNCEDLDGSEDLMRFSGGLSSGFLSECKRKSSTPTDMYYYDFLRNLRVSDDDQLVYECGDQVVRYDEDRGNTSNSGGFHSKVGKHKKKLEVDESYDLFLSAVRIHGGKLIYEHGDTIVKYEDDSETWTDSEQSASEMDEDQCVSLQSPSGDNALSKYEEDLNKKLRRKFNEMEFCKLMKLAKLRKKKEQMRVLRGRNVSCPTKNKSYSYLEYHPDQTLAGKNTDTQFTAKLIAAVVSDCRSSGAATVNITTSPSKAAIDLSSSVVACTFASVTTAVTTVKSCCFVTRISAVLQCYPGSGNNESWYCSGNIFPNIYESSPNYFIDGIPLQVDDYPDEH
ncbi:hypothetical protein GIB67_003037 [Kingdonia uniflora]|uniref:Uncharacterized protein n=1 Tax=Kingdonia uniflora TaxID=39325 RepID=A0A7J7LYI3_9MAGN|nr:hypothetical protein GIB67_003037 [Kingdonia uniflora]